MANDPYAQPGIIDPRFDPGWSYSDDQREARARDKAMSQGPPRDQATPYKREIIGEFSLKSPLTIKGNDKAEYTIPAGRHSIVGAVSLDGYELRDAAIVYDTQRTAPETGKRIFIPEPFHVPELAEAQKKGLVKIDEPHEHKVAEAIARIQAPEQKQNAGRGIGR
jgi:hypothetical protein